MPISSHPTSTHVNGTASFLLCVPPRYNEPHTLPIAIPAGMSASKRIDHINSAKASKPMFKALTRSFLLASLLAIPSMAQETSTTPSLAEQLAEKAASFAKRAPADRLATFANGISEVRDSGIEKTAKQVGDDAVDGTLKGWKGDSVTLNKLWSEGPVVLMWYRGGWCPYCNIQLRAMQQSLDEIE